MALISKVKDQRYCAYCKSKRTVYIKKHLDLINVVWVLIFSFCAGAGIWGEWDPRSLVILGLSIGACSAFLYIRWRFSIVCNFCGFDPVLYRRSPAEAAKRVRAFYEDKIKDPNFLLSKSPLLEVYRRQVESQRRQERIRAILQATMPQPQAKTRFDTPNL